MKKNIIQDAIDNYIDSLECCESIHTGLLVSEAIQVISSGKISPVLCEIFKINAALCYQFARGIREYFFGGITNKKYIEKLYNDGKIYQLHYVTAREAYNMAMAVSDGVAKINESPNKYLDYKIPRPLNLMKKCW